MCIPAIGNCKSTQQFTSLLISVAVATLCRSTPIGFIDSLSPALSASRPARLCRSTPVGSIHWLRHPTAPDMKYDLVTAAFVA
jgi:hypothetical protein